MPNETVFLYDMVFIGNEVFGYKSIAESLSKNFASVFVQDDSENAILLNQSPETFLG